MSVELYRERPFAWCLGKSIDLKDVTYERFPLKLFLLLTRVNGLPKEHHMKGHSGHNSSLIGREHLKMTVFQEMGIESKLLNQIQ